MSSLFFYGWWNISYVPLLLGTGLVDFGGALAIVRWKDYRKLFLILSLAANLGVLFFFKYLGFFEQIILDLQGISSPEKTPTGVILPIGLSFYTFQSMSYTIDVYRGRMKPTKNPLLFFSFISFFPHLVAGPIVRGREILPQLARVKITNEVERYHGIKLIVLGFFKKTVLADHLAVFVNEAFNSPSPESGYDYWWIAVLAFTFQIYFDFSGYSDIARGLAKIMGIHFRINFNNPYGSNSFRDFWSRWHMSLSFWFRDYVYVALGGNRRGKGRGILNMWITMLLSGLWHGANYTFIIWGALHSFFLSIERLIQIEKWTKSKVILKVGYMIIVFLGVALAWIFFRAKSLDQAIRVINQLGSFAHPFTGKYSDAMENALLFLKIIIPFQLYLNSGWRIRSLISAKHFTYLELFWLALLITCCVFFRGPGEQFIYFQF